MGQTLVRLGSDMGRTWVRIGSELGQARRGRRICLRYFFANPLSALVRPLSRLCQSLSRLCQAFVSPLSSLGQAFVSLCQHYGHKNDPTQPHKNDPTQAHALEAKCHANNFQVPFQTFLCKDNPTQGRCCARCFITRASFFNSRAICCARAVLSLAGHF